MASERVTTSLPSIACAKSFFKCNETLRADGSGGITDSVTGAVFNPAAGAALAGLTGNYKITNSAGASTAVYPQCDLSVEMISGVLPSFSNKAVILFACGRVVDASKTRIPYGDGYGDMGLSTNTGGVVSLSFAGGMHSIVNGSNAQLGVAGPDSLRVLPAVGTDVNLIVEYVPGVSLMAKAVDVNGATFGSGTSETIVTDLTVTLADVNPSLNNKTRFGGLAFYSIMAFTFDAGLPADRESVYRWLSLQHMRGNRILPPRWQGLAST